MSKWNLISSGRVIEVKASFPLARIVANKSASFVYYFPNDSKVRVPRSAGRLAGWLAGWPRLRSIPEDLAGIITFVRPLQRS